MRSRRGIKGMSCGSLRTNYRGRAPYSPLSCNLFVFFFFFNCDQPLRSSDINTTVHLM